MDIGVILKRFEAPDEVREMILGRFEVVRIGGLTVGRATYQPGWRWSEHVGPGVGAERCSVEHVGLDRGDCARRYATNASDFRLNISDGETCRPRCVSEMLADGKPHACLRPRVAPTAAFESRRRCWNSVRFLPRFGFF